MAKLKILYEKTSVPMAVLCRKALDLLFELYPRELEEKAINKREAEIRKKYDL